MSRSGYYDDDDDYDEAAQWRHIRWRGALTSAIRGKRGQALLRELLASLDALPEKRLIANSFIEPQDGAVCALGALGKARGIDLVAEFGDVDPEDSGEAAIIACGALDIACGVLDIRRTLAADIMDANDEGSRPGETPEDRFARMRRWVERRLIEWED